MNIAQRICDVAARFPEKPSVVLAKDKSFYTFQEFEERSNRLANRFQRLGIRPGMRTLLFVKPCLDFSVITFALFKLGAVPVLIDPGMGLPNLLNSVKQVRPEALISVGLVHWVRRLRSSFFSSVQVKISLNRVGGATHYLYDDLSVEASTFPPLAVTSDALAAILFTSGGTGIPKGVLYTHGILNAQTDVLQKMFSLDEHKTDLPGFPLFALFTLAMGMTSVIPEMDPTRPAGCDPAKIVRNIKDHGVTFVAGSPAIWERVGRYCVDNAITLASLEQVVMFGAPVRPEVHQLFQQVLPKGDTFTPYGATECLPVSLTSGSEILKAHLPLMRKGFGTCIGKAVPGVRLKIIKTSDIPEDALKECAPGEVGEIAVQGPQVTPGYFEMPEETKRSKILSEGELWHRMGDLGRLDQDQNLWFLGRKVHRVESETGTHFSIQLEAIFNQHPEIRKCALVKLTVDSKVVPGLVIERHDRSTRMSAAFYQELLRLRDSEVFTQPIAQFFLHKALPVDIRHNIKIDRTGLSVWAQKRLGKSLPQGPLSSQRSLKS